jgi:hypothetical protein
VAISKDRHARIIIMRPEITLHSEAGYIFADCSRQDRFFLQFGGGPYMLRQLRASPVSEWPTIQKLSHVSARIETRRAITPARGAFISARQYGATVATFYQLAVIGELSRNR